MSTYPAFFEDVRLEAATHWNLLDGNPVLAGPWHQLFMQVQSPRYVLSELLQNADDAGATKASVSVDGETFLFEHNGEDFSEDHFRSLCRFGYSNKRILHTIGFRGIGFKSTFSLGDRVELRTPTLSVGFHRKRFTEPIWVREEPDTSGRTRVAVRISDRRRQGEVEKNLEEWLKSPVSLLFFRNIRRIRIGDRELAWESLGPGPVPESEWMALNGDADAPHLSVRSEDEAFPDEALEEIRRERVLGSGEDVELPPCKVEIVSGAAGRFYVVLPTGVETALPFACNAPFIQDPSRREIKSPDSSPTNRWLLQRIGRLVCYPMWIATMAASARKCFRGSNGPTCRSRSGPGHIVCYPMWIATMLRSRASAARQSRKGSERRFPGGLCCSRKQGNSFRRSKASPFPGVCSKYGPMDERWRSWTGAGDRPCAGMSKAGTAGSSSIGVWSSKSKSRIFSMPCWPEGCRNPTHGSVC